MDYSLISVFGLLKHYESCAVSELAVHLSQQYSNISTLGAADMWDVIQNGFNRAVTPHNMWRNNP